MVQFKIVSGKKAGTVWVARRFPVRIGRANTADLQVEEDGVWDRHAQLEFKRDEGFVLSTESEALTAVNGQRIEQAVLRNGDTLELGSLRLQFWLGEARQKGLALGEWALWIGIVAVALGQVALICWLSR